MSALERVRGELASLQRAGLRAGWKASGQRGLDASRFLPGRDTDGDETGTPPGGLPIRTHDDRPVSASRGVAWRRPAARATTSLPHFRLSFSAAAAARASDVHVLSVYLRPLDDDKEVSALFPGADNLREAVEGLKKAEAAEKRRSKCGGVLAACRRFLSQPLALPGGANDDESGDDASEAGKKKEKRSASFGVDARRAPAGL